MPFVDDANDLVMVQSDLQESVEVSYYSRESSASRELGVGEGSTPTVVTLADHDEPALNEQLGVMPAPNPDMGQGSNVKTPASGKRGRPSQPSSVAATPVVASSPRTPRSAKNAAKSTVTPHSAKSAAVPKSARSTGGRKRKAEDDDSKEKSDAEAMPAAKRARTGRPSRTAGVAASARLAAKVANKPKRGRPKATTTAAEKKPKANKGGRPKKSEAAPVLAEFEVESILNMKTESGTTYYEVKWKGYPDGQNTWEPKKNLGGAKGLLKKFEAERKKSKIAEASKKASTAGNKKGAAKPAKPGKSVKKVAAPKKAAKAAPKTTPARSSGRPLRSRK